MVRNDPALLAEIDGWAVHRILECANDANYPYYNRTALTSATNGKPVFSDENEYFDNQVSTFTASRRFANTAMMPLAWFKWISSNIWYWIHVGKNSNGPSLERQGRSLTSWRPVGASAATEDPNMPEGAFTPVKVNWHAVKPWLKHLPKGSVRLVVTDPAGDFIPDLQVIAWKKPNGKRVVAVVNRAQSVAGCIINTGGGTFSGLRYDVANSDVVRPQQAGPLSLALPAFTAEFWTEL